MAAGVYRHLTPGHTYSLVRGFTDHDGCQHEPDDYWRYLGYSFLPYEDGLTLFFISNRAEEKTVRLQHRPETEGAIIDALDSYFVEVDYPFLPAFASITHVSDAGIESEDGRTVKAVSWAAIKRVTAAMGRQQYDMTLCLTIDHSYGKSIFFADVDPFWPLFLDKPASNLSSFTPPDVWVSYLHENPETSMVVYSRARWTTHSPAAD